VKNNKPEIKYIETKKLKLNPNNPRKNDNAVSSVMLSIEKYGFKNPLVCNTDYVVYCGNTRLKAARKLKIKELPCIIADDLTPEEIREFAIVDNKTSELAEWDNDLLKLELEELEGITDFGFDFGIELDEQKIPLTVEEDDPPEIDERPFTKKGDVWLLGCHRLICGDSTDEETVKKLVDGKVMDLLITDPPYNVNYSGKSKAGLKIQNDNLSNEEFYNFLLKAFTNAYNVLKGGGCYYVWFASKTHIAFESALIAAGLPVREELIWKKNSLVLGRQDYQWQHEPCFYGWKDGTHFWNSDRKQTTILEFNKPSKNAEHPTIKPVNLFHYEIQNSTKKGQKVLDLFAGSGTTLIACEQNGRECYLSEIDEKYCDVIVKRYVNFMGEDKDIFVLREDKKIPYKELFNN